MRQALSSPTSLSETPSFSPGIVRRLLQAYDDADALACTYKSQLIKSRERRVADDGDASEIRDWREDNEQLEEDEDISDLLNNDVWKHRHLH